eukprot:UN20267
MLVAIHSKVLNLQIFRINDYVFSYEVSCINTKYNHALRKTPIVNASIKIFE